MIPDAATLEAKIGYWFGDRGLLARALTHATLSNEDPLRPLNNKTLAFLGDAVLELAVREEVFERGDMSKVGPLSLAADANTRNARIAEISARHRLGDWISAGEGEKRNQKGEARRLADAFEALLGAVYLDSKGGRDAIRVARRLIGEAPPPEAS